MQSQEAFGIFEGGGAKGIALVGALKAIHEAKIEFVGWGGTSAGAIVAALAAAGWTAGELEQLMLGKNFADFLDSRKGEPELTMADLRNLWAELGPITNGLSEMKPGICAQIRLARKLRNSPHLKTLRIVGKRLQENKGIFAGEEFKRWMFEQLESKLAHKRFSFSDLCQMKGETRKKNGELDPLPEPLYVVSTHHLTKTARIYGRSHSDVPIAEAVRASMAIPFFFEPFDNQVDGGLISNFPSWVFDEHKETYGSLPTIGVRLVSKSSDPDPKSLSDFLGAIVSSGLEGKDELEAEGRKDLFIIPIDITDLKIGTFDLDLSRSQREALHRRGYESGQRVLSDRKLGLKYDDGYKSFERVKDSIFQFLSEKDIRFPPEAKPRFNVFRPEGRVFRLSYHFEMDHDPDRRLVLRNNEGAVALACREQTMVITDTIDAEPRFWIEDSETGEFALKRGNSAHFLTKENEGKVGRAKLIVSHCVRRPDGKQIVGVFNFDSEAKGTDVGLFKSRDELYQSKAKQLAKKLREELSHLGAHLTQ